MLFFLLLPSLTSVPPLELSSNITSFGLLLSVSACSAFSSYQFGVLSSIGVIHLHVCLPYFTAVHSTPIYIPSAWLSVQHRISKLINVC